MAKTTIVASECFKNVQQLKQEIELLEAKKKKELAAMCQLLNARLQLWSKQFTDTDISALQFDGTRGFTFWLFGSRKRPEEIHSEQRLSSFNIEGNKVEVWIEPCRRISGFKMAFPLRYLDLDTGEAAIVRDATWYKQSQVAQSSLAMTT